MKIRPKIQVAFLIVGFIPLLVFGWFNLDHAVSILKDRILDQLDSVASVQEKRLHMEIDRNLERLKLVSSRTQLRLNLRSYTQAPAESFRSGILRILNDAKNSIPSFRKLSVVGLDGRVVASTDSLWNGVDVSQERFFERGLVTNQADTFTTNNQGTLIIILSGPLILDGKTIGVIVVEASGNGFISLTHSYEGLSMTGETILLQQEDGKTLRYLTPLRFDPGAIMRTVPGDARERGLLEAAFDSAEPALLQALDYRGVPVLAVTRNVGPAEDNPDLPEGEDKVEEPARPHSKLGLIVKVDRDEVFAPVQKLRRLSYLILGGTFLVVLAISLFLSHSLTRPILGLSRTAHQISVGHLEQRARARGNDEIAVLAGNFNRMAEGLTESNRNLEKKVEERTRELEAIRERYSLAVRGSADGLWDWDIRTNSVAYSDRFKELLGYGPDGFENAFASWESRLHPEDKEHILAAVQAHLEKREPYDVEYRLACRDGTYRWFRARGMAVWDASGRATRMAGSISDVTDRKLAEQELQRSNEELERFAYVASHDLKEPLRMVTSYLQLLEKRHLANLAGEAREFIQIALEGAERMRCLIEDLLHYSRISTRGMVRKPTQTDQVVQTALAHLQSSIQERAAQISVGELPAVMGDEIPLIQLFQNLLGNALKFCPKDRAPEIQISASSLDGRWQFAVKDNGIGIDPASQKRIFQIFQRGCRREEYEGTGIGLAVCQKIVERHGGHIWVKSEPDQGSTFFFTLPAAA
jgi:PAS domain S-box-containing protein